MKYRIYIDEVGNSDLESSDNPNHRFLSLTGVILDLKYVADVLNPQMEAFKQTFFGSHPDEPIILHRKEILNAKPPFEALQSESTRKNFDAQLLKLIHDWEYKVITICIDKKKHTQTYSTWRHDPYHYCLEVLIERYIFFLDSTDSQGDVMAESRGGKEDMRLKKTFHRLYEDGTNFIKPDRFAKRLTSSQLKVKSKANNISGLQLADLLAHASRNEILAQNELRNDTLPDFGKKISEILRCKYYQKEGKMFGKKLI